MKSKLSHWHIFITITCLIDNMLATLSCIMPIKIISLFTWFPLFNGAAKMFQIAHVAYIVFPFYSDMTWELVRGVGCSRCPRPWDQSLGLTWFQKHWSRLR